MRITRVYEPQKLESGKVLVLSEQNAAHLCKVLRLPAGAELAVFDGQGHEFSAHLTAAGKKAEIQIDAPVLNQRESPVYTILGQVISRGDKMDLTIQKAVELGVSEIYPLSSVRCGVKLDEKRQDKKIESWQKIAASACEQSGRAFVPTVHPVTPLSDFCKAVQQQGRLCLTLDPCSTTRIRDLSPTSEICLLIGPEGGFDPEEIALSEQYQFKKVSLGPRILRTETAALTALSIIGSHFGDL